MVLGFPRAKQGLCHYDIWGGDPPLIRSPPKTADPNQNPFFQAEDGIRDVERSRGLGDVYKRQGPSLIRYSSKTAEQNFMKLSGIVHYMMPYCTSYFKILSA